MELMDGDLAQLQDKEITPAAKKKIVLKIKEALLCLLGHDRYYADLWAPNVFFNYSEDYKENGEDIKPEDIETVKLGDLGSICKKDTIIPAYFSPPSHWQAFRGIGWGAPCTEDTMVWQFALVVVELYTGNRVGRELKNESRDDLRNRLTRLRKDLTTENFPDLQISKFKEVFNLDLNNTNYIITLKDLFKI